MSEALSSLDDDITEVMRRAKAMGHDPLATARQRYPDAHSSAFTEAQLRLYKAEKAAFEASVERAADQTIDSDCVDVTPTSQALTIPAPGCAGPKQPAAPVSASA